MDTRTFLTTAIAPAMTLLPPAMDSTEARAFLIAIALQESKLAWRTQIGGGPARSFYEFEAIGVRGVLEHPLSAKYAYPICELLEVVPQAATVWRAITYHDVLASVFARLLLWTLPSRLPSREQEMTAWKQYLESWRPGKPRVADWHGNWQAAWSVFPETGENPA